MDFVKQNIQILVTFKGQILTIKKKTSVAVFIIHMAANRLVQVWFRVKIRNKKEKEKTTETVEKKTSS